MRNVFILDACAIIAFLNNEEGAEKVESLFLKSIAGECEIYVHAINLYEVYYDFLRNTCRETDGKFWNDMTKFPFTIIFNLDFDILKIAAKFKINYRISLADSFVLALAKTENGQVVTSDHHEFEAIDNNDILDFIWIR